MKPVRCAIYTRKSSEEGLEQGFNSLHAQREACAAYVMSQASEGWTLLTEEYDDGGLSGGTLERPALQRLLGHVAAGLIDIIVVYKVDRLTRSLLDFAKLVEALDKAGTSFVSITQSFNTTTSLGRLTLNMLLSFAQFEREVTAERIRDKLAASKAKGMWMGGVPPLGYRGEGRTLAIVEEHAAIIRRIYARYRRLGSVRLLSEELQAKGVVTPVRTTGTGRELGGKPFSRGQLYAILRNPVYVGDIAHRDKVYPGNHPPLVGRSEWEAVQRQLAGHIKGERCSRVPSASLLGGILVGSDGEPLIATHSRKNSRRYPYYVSKGLHLRTADIGMRLPAADTDNLVINALSELLGDPLHLAGLAQLSLEPATLSVLMERAATQKAALAAEPRTRPTYLDKVCIGAEGVTLTINAAALASCLSAPLEPDAPDEFVHACAVRLTRTGRAIRLVHDNGARVVGRDRTMQTILRHVIKARGWWHELRAGTIDPTGLAKREGVTDSYVVKVVRFAFLSPRVLDALVAGTLKAEVDANRLLKPGAISPDWLVQENALIAG